MYNTRIPTDSVAGPLQLQILFDVHVVYAAQITLKYGKGLPHRVQTALLSTELSWRGGGGGMSVGHRECQ